MLGKILSGFLGPVSQQSPAMVEQEGVKSSETAQQPQQDSAESIQGTRFNAFERMSETENSSRMLATQLQSCLDAVKNEEEAKKAEEWCKTLSVIGPIVTVVVPEVVTVTYATVGTAAEKVNPGADADPAARVKTESSDQKESLLPK